MTELHSPLPQGSPRTAADAADRAARSAGVEVREIVELAECAQVYRLFDRIWRPDPTNPPVTTELMRALTKSGNYVAGAYAGDELVGACVGFFGSPVDQVLHSHVAGVAPDLIGRSVGHALKLHQRAWALRRGVAVIEWTFDPLVSRNAYFNLTKLAATAAEYLPNFYGGMNDNINGEDESDRLLVHWRLASPAVDAVRTGAVRPGDVSRGREVVTALGRSDRGAPVVGSLDGRILLVAAPTDIVRLRAADPGLAREWRFAVRHALGTLMAEGAEVLGFTKTGWYVVSRWAGPPD